MLGSICSEVQPIIFPCKYRWYNICIQSSQTGMNQYKKKCDEMRRRKKEKKICKQKMQDLHKIKKKSKFTKKEPQLCYCWSLQECNHRMPGREGHPQWIAQGTWSGSFWAGPYIRPHAVRMEKLSMANDRSLLMLMIVLFWSTDCFISIVLKSSVCIFI